LVRSVLLELLKARAKRHENILTEFARSTPSDARFMRMKAASRDAAQGAERDFLDESTV